MIFLLCCAAARPAIIWHEHANYLAEKLDWTTQQIMTITAVDLLSDCTESFNRTFSVQLTWEQIKEFRRAVFPLLRKIVHKDKTKCDKPLSNKHPLLKFYEAAVVLRDSLN